MPDKAIFLDRDDTLIMDPGYLSDPDQIRLIDGVASALIQFRALGYRLVVISNQSAVARGIITEKQLGGIHGRLKEVLGQKGAYLDAIYYCPYHPEGTIPRYRKESELRKPAPGMLLTAAEEMDIDLTQSWMIGNSARDIQAGRAAGCMTILVDPPTREVRFEDLRSNPDYRAINLKEAVNIIKLHNRAATRPVASPAPEPPKPIVDEPKAPEEVPPVEPAPPVPETPPVSPPVAQPEPPQVVEEQPTPEPVPETPPTPEPVAESNTQIPAPEPAPRPSGRIAFPAKPSSKPRPVKLKDLREHPPQTGEPMESPVEPVEKPVRTPPRRTARQLVSEESMDDASTQDLLREILDQLKILNRDEMFSEFSAMRFLAGILQVLVIFCLAVTAWYLLNPSKGGDQIYVSLGFAIVLQLMALTFYLMQGRK